MVCEPDLITTGEAMYMKYIVINSGWYTMGRDYLLNETGESFLNLDLQPCKLVAIGFLFVQEGQEFLPCYIGFYHDNTMLCFSQCIFSPIRVAQNACTRAFT